MISILAILSTTGFLFAAEHTSQARDARRVADINTLYDSAQMRIAHAEHLPVPKNNYLAFTHSGEVIGYQSKIELPILSALSLGDQIYTDSSGQDAYTYRLHANKEFVQFMGFLERPSSSKNFSLLQIFRKDETSKAGTEVYPYARGDNLGIFLSSDGKPLNDDTQGEIKQEITSVLQDTSIMIVSNETKVLSPINTNLQEIKTATV